MNALDPLDWSAAAAVVLLLFVLLYGVTAREKRSLLLVSAASAGLFGLGHLILRLGLLHPVTAPLQSIQESALVVLATLFWAATALAFKFSVDRFVWDGLLRLENRASVPQLVRQFVTLAIVLVTVMAIVRFVFDQPVTGLIATSGVVAVILGYSAQSTLSEVFSGLSLNLSQAFKPAEWVQIDGVDGQIVDSNWRAVTLRNFDRNLVQVPNTVAASTRIISYDRPAPFLRRSVDFEADYTSSPAMVKQVSEAAMRDSKLVMTEPAPFTIGLGFGEYGVKYRAYWYGVDASVWVPDSGEMVSAIWHAFERAEIPFGYARRDGLAFVPPLTEAPARRAPVDTVALIRGMQLFQALSDDDVAELALDAPTFRFGPPERIIREGEPGDSMFLLASGHVAVSIEQGDEELQLADVGPGDQVGLMTLLTGEPRSATVRAIDLVEVVEIRKAALQPILERRAELVDAFANEAMQLQLQNQKARDAYAEAHRVPESHKRTLVSALAGRIRGFFAP